MVRWLLMVCLLSTAGAVIQDEDVEKLTGWKTGRLQVSPETPVSPQIAATLGRNHSPNPPDCAIDIADALNHGTEIAYLIIAALTDCTQFFRDEDNQELCASDILGIFALFSWVLEDAASADFACSNVNAGCEEAAFESMRVLFEAIENLAYSVDICGDVAQFTSDDAPVDGFICWLDVWKVVERLVRAGKSLDVAIDLCPSPHGLIYDGQKPPTEDNISSTPPPLVSTNQGQVRRHVRAKRRGRGGRLGAMPANWSALSQPEPFANLRGAVPNTSSAVNSTGSSDAASPPGSAPSSSAAAPPLPEVGPGPPAAPSPIASPSSTSSASSSSSSSSSANGWSFPSSLPAFGPAFPSAPSAKALDQGLERRRRLADNEDWELLQLERLIALLEATASASGVAAGRSNTGPVLLEDLVGGSASSSFDASSSTSDQFFE